MQSCVCVFFPNPHMEQLAHAPASCQDVCLSGAASTGLLRFVGKNKNTYKHPHPVILRIRNFWPTRNRKFLQTRINFHAFLEICDAYAEQ